MIHHAFLACCLIVFLSSPARCDTIHGSDIYAISNSMVGSGNGTINLRMMTFSGSEITNEKGSYNADNGNNTLPQGGGDDTSAFIESYITTGLELKDFYRLNFPDGLGGSFVDQLALFVDLDETGNPHSVNNSFDRLDIVLNPTSVNGGPDPSLDVTSAQQAAINQIYTGGTIVANLNSIFNLPVIYQGAGHADYAVMTGLNPFDLADSDVVLFNISMSKLNNGPEEWFISSDLAPQDVVPEPSFVVGFLLMLGGLAVRRRGRQ